MGSRLWFIRKNGEPVYVFPSRRSALYELDALRREDDRAGGYSLYPVDIDDLEDHPTEMRLAEKEGLI